MQLPVYNTQGQKVNSLDLNPAVFAVKPKPHVLHEAVVAQQANARVAIAHTKTRGEVRAPVAYKREWYLKSLKSKRVQINVI